MSATDFEALERAPLDRDPFDHLVVPGFVRAAALDDVNAAFPKVDRPGSFPMSELSFGGAFAALIEELSSDRLRLALQDCGRRLGAHIRKTHRIRQELKKRSYIEKYIPAIGEALRDILQLKPRQVDRICGDLKTVLERSRKL